MAWCTVVIVIIIITAAVYAYEAINNGTIGQKNQDIPAQGGRLAPYGLLQGR
jgi:hypothetical protein